MRVTALLSVVAAALDQDQSSLAEVEHVDIPLEMYGLNPGCNIKPLQDIWTGHYGGGVNSEGVYVANDRERWFYMLEDTIACLLWIPPTPFPTASPTPFPTTLAPTANPTPPPTFAPTQGCDQRCIVEDYPASGDKTRAFPYDTFVNMPCLECEYPVDIWITCMWFIYFRRPTLIVGCDTVGAEITPAPTPFPTKVHPTPVPTKDPTPYSPTPAPAPTYVPVTVAIGMMNEHESSEMHHRDWTHTALVNELYDQKQANSRRIGVLNMKKLYLEHGMFNKHFNYRTGEFDKAPTNRHKAKNVAEKEVGDYLAKVKPQKDSDKETDDEPVATTAAPEIGEEFNVAMR